MNQPVRKPGEGGKVTDSLPADDPSIPVLTERLTLPPLDLDLDFRLPPRPGEPAEPSTHAPEPRPVPLDDATRYAPLDETRYAPLDRSLHTPADEARYAPADDEATRLAPQARGFEPTPFPSTQSPSTRAPGVPAATGSAAPALDEGPATRGGTGVLGAETLGGPATRTGVDSRLGADTRTRVDTRSGFDTRTGFASPPLAEGRGGTHTVVPAPEPPDTAPRVPTSLLVSNLNTLLSTPTQTHRKPQPDDFDLTAADGGQGIDQLDAELRERILLDLARRLPTEVDTIVRRHLEPAVEEAVRRFTAEVRIALAGSLREIVDRAVKAELERLKNPRS
jgi:hypothetical protein